MGRKITYEVGEDETIAACLKRMAQDGYVPVKRIEKPVFREGDKAGEVEPIRQKIIFEAREQRED